MTFLELFQTDVRIERDLTYRSENADERHRLDVYSAPDAESLPVVVYFHGGGWHSGDKRLFEHLGRAFVVRGMVAVTVNYRLTPDVTHPEHARDCAEAVAWVQQNISSYGGDPSQVFLCGHSAGGHLASIVVQQEHFAQEAGFDPSSIQGVVMISAASDLSDYAGTTSFTSADMIHLAFGESHDALWAASPAAYVRSGLPPYLVIVAEDDPEGLQEQGRNFSEELRQAGTDVIFIRVLGRDHFSIVRRFGPSDDTTANAIGDFVAHHSGGATAVSRASAD